MKGTRLNQPPGSPLIGGRSRTHRPFWSMWLTATALALVVGLVVFTVTYSLAGDAPADATIADHLESAVRLVGSLGWPGALLGAALGVGLCRLMGWRHQVLIGAALGAVGAVGSSMALIGVILARW